MGPLFFLLFVNDLPNISNFETTFFADDTNLHLSHHNINILQSQVVTEINKISNWMNTNNLTINYKKSCCMIISNKSNKSTHFKLTINDNAIEKSDNVKYLGVHFDNKLTWEKHINTMSKKFSKVCGMIHKLRHYVPLSTLKLIYFSMFHSQIQYSLLNWGRTAKNHLRKLEVLQNNILRACLFLPRNYPTTSLYSKLKVLKIKDMFQMEIAKFMYKFNNQMLLSFFDSYFVKPDKVHNYNTIDKKVATNFINPLLVRKLVRNHFIICV